MQLEALLVQNNDLLINQHKTFEAELASRDREIAELRRTVQVQENNEKRNKMLLKMKEEGLKRYKKNGPEALQEHVKDLMEEIKLLKDTEEYKNPHVARLMSENTALKEELRGLRTEDTASLSQHLHEANNFLEELNEYIHQTYQLRSELQEKLDRMGGSSGDIVMRGASEGDSERPSPFKRPDDSLSSKEIQEQQSNQRFQELEELLQQRTETYENRIFELNETLQTKEGEMEEMRERFEQKLASERERLNETLAGLKEDLVARDNKDIPELKVQIVRLEEETNQATQTANEVMAELEKVNHKYMEAEGSVKEQRKILTNLQQQLDDKEKEVEQVSINFGIFLCSDCANIHSQ